MRLLNCEKSINLSHPLDTRAYIESGILEQYALGVVSDQERREVECLSNIYPEIAAELVAMSDVLSLYSQQFQKTPPPHLRERLLEQIEAEPRREEEPPLPTNVRPLNPPPADNATPYRWLPLTALAAAALVLVVMGTQWINQLLDQQAGMAQQQQAMQQQIAQLQSDRQEVERQWELLKNSQAIALRGTPQHPANDAMVMWDEQSKTVHLAAFNLPPPPAHHQYQLWALWMESPST